MVVIEPPHYYFGAEPSLFLAGGISGCPDWQQELITLLGDVPLVIFNPRRTHFPIEDPNAARDQIKWEYIHLRKATAISFWFPCETLCPIVLYELGAWSMTHKPLFIGVHPQYQRLQDVLIQTALARADSVIMYFLEDLAQSIRTWAKEQRGDPTCEQGIIPFQRTSLPQIDHILQQRYNDSLSKYMRSKEGTLREFTNETHRLQVKVIFADDSLWYRELSLHDSTQDQEEKVKEFTIIVNARKNVVVSEEVSFDQVVRLAFDTTTFLFRVTYRLGPEANPEGTLLKDGTVKLTDGMIFNVTATEPGLPLSLLADGKLKEH